LPVGVAREGDRFLLSFPGLVWLPEHGPWRLVKRGWLRGLIGSLSSGHAQSSCVQFAAAHGWSRRYSSMDWRVSQQ